MAKGSSNDVLIDVDWKYNHIGFCHFPESVRRLALAYLKTILCTERFYCRLGAWPSFSSTAQVPGRLKVRVRNNTKTLWQVCSSGDHMNLGLQ